jgi:hypothetical protein
MQVTNHPQVYSVWGLPDAQRSHLVDDYHRALRTAVKRIVVNGLTPEQAAAEVIALVKQSPSK